MLKVTINNVTYNVYALSIDGVTFRYVGATKYDDPTKKAKQYMRGRLQASTPVFLWIREEVAADHIITATFLEINCADDVRHREQWWIRHLQDKGYDLLNRQTGGTKGFTQPSWNKGLNTGPHSLETKEKISRALMGRVGHRHSDETKAKISAARRGKPLSDEHRQKLSDAHKGQIPWNKRKKGDT